MTIKGDGIRKNEGKLRVDLVPTQAIEGIAEVLTFGLDKYPERNWSKGMPWSKVYSSMFRHMLAFWKGEDLDKESQLSHIKHILSNAAFLAEYIETYPEGDDRPNHVK